MFNANHMQTPTQPPLLGDPATEQYMHVEGIDDHDHPKFTMRWRQVAGPCGEAMDESDLASWDVFYDGSSDAAPDRPPTFGTENRVKLNLLVCAPFGEYEIDIDMQSFDDASTTRTTRMSFEIENGPDEFHIWDSLESDVREDEAYSPTIPGNYTWPLKSATGYYKTFYAGLLPPRACPSALPSGTELVGCFDDSSESPPLFNSDYYVLSLLGPDGMSAQVCSDFCSGFEYFGLESGSECFCGTADEFENAVSSDLCGVTYPALCTGDATTACGGFDAISVYQRTGHVALPLTPTPTPASVYSPTPGPVPAPTPAIKSETTYSLVGCFADSKSDRIMENMMAKDVMSAEICHELCDDGINTHFGTQYAEECWCAIDPNLTKHSELLVALEECDAPCECTTTGETCGGTYKIQDVVPGYIGCFADDRAARAMDAEEMYVSEDMTNEICISYCAGKGHSYAGTQYSEQCFCGDASYRIYGEIPDVFCSYPCEGDADELCGGFDALSVYATA